MTVARAILVVDDELEACRNLSDIFTDLGYRVDVAASAESAIVKATQSKFDIALLDLMLPTDDGITLFARLKLLQPRIEGYVITAHPQHARVASAQSAGVTKVLPKPVDISALLTILGETDPLPNDSAACAF